MMIKRNYLILFLVLTSILLAKDKNSNYYEAIARQIPQGKVLTITEFRGNYADEFTRNLISNLKNRSDISFVDYDIHRKVLEESLKYSEPVFDKKHSSGMPVLTSPDLGIIGSANMQKSNFLFKQKEHLDFNVNIVDLNSGVIILNVNERIQMKKNPPILLLIIVILLIIAVSRWIIFLKNGYSVLFITSFAMFLITLIIVWYLL